VQKAETSRYRRIWPDTPPGLADTGIELVSVGEWFGESVGEGYLVFYNLHKR
jgi:hypothetical protein